MDISFISLIIFIIITIVYYLVLKPKLEIDMLGDLTEYTNSCNIMLLVYFLLIIIVQLALNTGIIVNKCGGNISQNFGIAFLITIIPWIFIFGAVTSFSPPVIVPT